MAAGDTPQLREDLAQLAPGTKFPGTLVGIVAGTLGGTLAGNLAGPDAATSWPCPTVSYFRFTCVVEEFVEEQQNHFFRPSDMRDNLSVCCVVCIERRHELA